MPFSLPSLTTPLIPQEWIEPITKRLEEPSLTRSPRAAALRGLLSGSLSGLQQWATPANVGMAVMPGLGALRGASAAGRAVKGLQSVRSLADATGRALGPLAKIGPVTKGLSRNVPAGAEEAFLKYVSKPW